MGLRTKKIMGVQIQFSGFIKNQYIWGDCLKRGLGQFAYLRGDLTKKSG